jgi:hypothetical protein
MPLRRARHLLAFALVACGGSPSPQPPPPRPALGVEHGHLVDAEGRTATLRGVNLRAADFFDDFKARLPLPPFDADADCRVIGEDLGMNQIRLAINWSYLEPERGRIDQTYLDRVVAIAAACASHGVATLVDLHQDGFSKYVGEDGAPFWAHAPALPPEDIDERHGGQASTSAAAQAAFDGFFADTDGLVADYARMAAQVAAFVAGKPGVIGLELMNEPLAGPAELDAFHRTVGEAVRAAAPELLVFFEPVATRNVLDFARPGVIGVSDVVYAPHLYTGVFQGDWTVGDDARIEASVQGMLDEALANDAPVFVTELGNYPMDPTGAAWLDAAFASLDRHMLSASIWVYEEWPSTCGQPSCWGFFDTPPSPDAPLPFARELRDAAVTLMARPFPQAIAGELDAFAYTAATRTLSVQLHGATAGGVHVLSAPRRVYPGDVVVTCDGQAASATRAGGRVEVACAGTSLTLAPGP